MVARRIGDEVILVPIRNNAGDLQCIYSLSEVGALVWERIDGVRTFTDLIGLVCSQFDASPDEVERDLSEFLAHLEQIGALVPA